MGARVRFLRDGVGRVGGAGEGVIRGVLLRNHLGERRSAEDAPLKPRALLHEEGARAAVPPAPAVAYGRHDVRAPSERAPRRHHPGQPDAGRALPQAPDGSGARVNAHAAHAPRVHDAASGREPPDRQLQSRGRRRGRRRHPAAAGEEAGFVPYEHDGQARELRGALGDHARPVHPHERDRRAPGFRQEADVPRARDRAQRRPHAAASGERRGRAPGR